jgi:hypothetical protein
VIYMKDAAVLWRRRVSACVALLLASPFVIGCAATFDAESVPERAHVTDRQLTREWVADDSSVALGGEGVFSAQSLLADYYNCKLNGVRVRSGSGQWKSVTGRGGTDVSLRFSDGCTVTLWAGKAEDAVILFTYGTHDEIYLLH